MRLVAGAWRGRTLVAPSASATRPTAERVRQALFDTLIHAPWGGREVVEGAVVLDVFAGTGALGLEALSRGAVHATFVERAPEALAALRTNIRRCGAESMTTILPLPVERAVADRTVPPANLVFMDPPYGLGLVPVAMDLLTRVGWIRPGATVVAETEKSAPSPFPEPLDSRIHGAARTTIWRCD